MLHFRKLMHILLAALLLVQPVFAEELSETQPPEPDIISAVHEVEELPTNWSPLSPETEERRFLLDLTTAPLYALSPEGNWQGILAKELPADVTAEYAGTYGIPTGAAGGYAYRISLSTDARWDDGLMINADDYIFSIEKLLENEENRSDWTFLANAQEILSGKRKTVDEIIPLSDTEFPDADTARAAGYTDLYIDTTGFWGLEGGWRPISDRRGLQDFAMPSGMDERFVSPAYLFATYLDSGREFARFQKDFLGLAKGTSQTMTMDDLGLIKTGPFELVLLLDEPLAPSVLMQKLQKLFLFRESCWGKDFATSAETYCGYGPYRITAADSYQIILEPSESWRGAPVTADFDRIICRKIGS